MTDNIAFLMSDAARLFRRSFDADTRQMGVTGQQWRALVQIARNPGINQGAAADLLEVEPITVSRMIDRLCDAGLVERRAHPDDRRAWQLYLTPAGEPLVDQLRTIAFAKLDRALTGFSAAERDQLADLIDRFRANLSAPSTASIQAREAADVAA
jgi:DNA-binding MarR family transcriptional regulator